MILETLREAFKTKPSEIETNYTGQKVWLSLADKNLTEADILWIQREHGYNAAGWVLYKYFKEKSQNSRFLNFIDNHKNNYSKAHADYMVVVVAHNPWATLVQNEEYGWRLKNLAVDMGLTTFVPELGYRRSIFANAFSLQENLKVWTSPGAPGHGKKILFLSHAVGSLEVKWFLQKSQLSGLDIIGWMNIAGLMYGTALPPTNSKVMRSFLNFLGGHPINPDVLRSNSYCRNSLDLKIPLVSLLPISSTTKFKVKDHWANADLKHWGPHDGFSSLVDYMQSPGIVWPLWGEQHFMDIEVYKNRIQAAFKYILQQQQTLAPQVIGETHLALGI